MCDAITCVSVSHGNQKRRQQATYVSIRAEECDILEPLTETPVRGNVIVMLQMRRCGLHVMVVSCGGGKREEVW